MRWWADLAKPTRSGHMTAKPFRSVRAFCMTTLDFLSDRKMSGRLQDTPVKGVRVGGNQLEI